MGDEASPNPYEPSRDLEQGPIERRTRWRIFPAALLGTFGLFLVIGSSWMVVAVGYELLVKGTLPDHRRGLLIVGPFAIVEGVCFLIASGFVWNKRWWSGIFFFALGAGIGWLASRMAPDF